MSSLCFAILFLLNVQTIRQDTVIFSPSVEGDTGFGIAIDMERDYVLVGTRGEAAYLFERDEKMWSEGQRLAASDGKPGDGFGSTVSISGDYMVVGAPGYDTNLAANVGAVYVYHRNGAHWVEEAKLIASDATPDKQFGRSIALDGSRLLVGSSGKAYLFEKNESTEWLETSQITPGGYPGVTGFGYNVALRQNRLAIASFTSDDILFSFKSNAYVYELENGVWNRKAIISAGNGSGPTPLSFSDNYLVYGTQGWPSSDPVPGHCGIIRQNGNSWDYEVRLGGGFKPNSFCISLSIDEHRIVVGSPSEKMDDVLVGAAYIYDQVGDEWVLTNEFRPQGGAEQSRYRFGEAVAVQGDYVVVGAPGLRNKGGYTPPAYDGSGNVYLFELKSVEVIPNQFRLYQSFPNPFNESTTIRFDLARDQWVFLDIFDSLGRRVKQIINEHLNAGSHSVSFSGSGLSSGVYVYRLRAGDLVATRRLILIQ